MSVQHTAALQPIVSTPVVAVRAMLPPEPVVTAPEVVRLPVLPTVTAAPGVCVMPVTVSVPAVLVRLIPPLVPLLAVKLPTVFAPPSVCPLCELVLSNPVLPIFLSPDSATTPTYTLSLHDALPISAP